MATNLLLLRAQRGFTSALELAGQDPEAASWVHMQSPDFEYPQRRAAQDPDVRLVTDLDTQLARRWRVNNGTPRPISVDRAFLKRHPAIVQRYLVVLVRTAQWASRNGAPASALIALDSPGYTLPQIQGAHGPQLHRSLMPSLQPDYIAALAEQKEFLLRWRYIGADFDPQDWIAATRVAAGKAALPAT